MATTRARKRAAAPAAATPLIIHENNGRGEHRIVRVVDGKSQHGEWASIKDIARLDDLRAATDAFSEVLPQGVFTARVKEFVSL